jgi:rod shape-determining protein MreC
MNKILEFFYKYLSVVIFLILEILAFLLVVNKNDLQRSVAFRYATTLSAWTYEVTNLVTDYFGLAEANKYLAEENARLYKEIADYKSKFVDSVDVQSMVTYQSSENYLSAKVVFNSVYDLQNYIIIDKGNVHGVEEDMGVFAPQGVVGVVQRVSKNYAVVLPIINPEQVISAKIKGNNQLGSVKWDGKSPLKAKLYEIPSHVNVVAGDTVVTSGFSAIFPEGVMIGVVDKAAHVENTMYCDVDINLAVDFQSLSYVTVAVFENKNELLNLQKSLGK